MVLTVSQGVHPKCRVNKLEMDDLSGDAVAVSEANTDFLFHIPPRHRPGKYTPSAGEHTVLLLRPYHLPYFSQRGIAFRTAEVSGE